MCQQINTLRRSSVKNNKHCKKRVEEFRYKFMIISFLNEYLFFSLQTAKPILKNNEYLKSISNSIILVILFLFLGYV